MKKSMATCTVLLSILAVAAGAIIGFDVYVDDSNSKMAIQEASAQGYSDNGINFTAAERTWLDDNTSISVGYSNWPPFEYHDNDGLAGVSGAMAAKFSMVTGSNFEADSDTTWSQTLSGLQDGTIDVAFMIANTGSDDTAREGIAYTDRWYIVNTTLIVKSGNPSAVTMDNLADKRVVTVEGYAINTWLDDNNISFTEVASTAIALNGVSDGTYDVHIESWDVASRISAQNGIIGLYNAGVSGYQYELSIGYNTNNTVLGSILQKTLDATQSERAQLIADALAPPIAGDFTAAESTWIGDNPSISVGYSNWPPFEYHDNDGLAGVSGAMAAKFSEVIGSDFETDSDTTWGQTLSGLQDGTIGVAFMIANTGPSDTARAGIAYTDPWYFVDTNLIVKSGNPSAVTMDNLADKRVVTVEGYAINTWLTANNISFTEVGSTAAALNYVADGTYDVHIESWDVASRISAQNGIIGLYNAGVSGYQYELSIGYDADNAVLGSILQKTLDATQSERAQLIADALAPPTAGDFTAAERTWLDDNTSISVGYSNWPPFEYHDNDGLAGVSGAMAAKFSEVIGSDFVAASGLTWGQTLSGLQDGTIGVAFMIENTGPSDTARAGIAYTDPWYIVDTNLIVKSGNPYAVTMNNLADKRVVTVEGYAINTWLTANNISFTEVASTAAALNYVADGTYDVHIESWDVASRISAQNGIIGLYNAGVSGYQYELSIGYDADNAVLGSILQKTLDATQSERAQLIADALAPPTAGDFTAAERTWLDDNTSISVGYSNWPPFEYYDNGLAGVSGAMAAKFSEVIGSDFVAASGLTWGQTLSGLQDGTIGVAFMIENTGPSDTARAGIAYTDPWYFVDTNLIVKSGNPYAVTMNNLADKRVVSVEGYAINTWLDDNNISFTEVASTAAALNGVADGTYDVHIESWEVASRIGADNGITGLYNAGVSGYQYELSIGYDADNAVLGSILQKTLDATQSERAQLIADALAPPTAGDFTAAERTWLDDNTSISVGYSNWPPFEYYDNGLAGVSGAMAAKFSEVIGSDFVAASGLTWGQTLSGLQDGTIGVAFMIENTGPSDTARAGIAYTDPWYFVDTNLIVKSGNPYAVTMNNLADKRVVSVEGYAINTWLDDNNISFTEVASTAAALNGVADGTYDVHIESWEVASRIGADNGITGLYNAGVSGYQYELSIGYDADNAVLGSILQKTLDATQSERAQLIADALAPPTAGDFTAAERTWLDDNTSISVGYSNWPPFEYYDNGLAGVSGAMAAKFSEVIGSDFVAASGLTWGQTLSGLQDGTIGVAFMIENTGPSDTARAGIAYTDPWYFVDTNLIVKSGNPYAVTMNNLADKRVVSVEGYAINTWLDDNNISFTEVASTAAALNGVADGTYDVHIESWEVASRIGADNGITGLYNAGVSGYQYELSIGYDADNAVLGSILQKTLDATQSERAQLIADALNPPTVVRICR